MTLGLSRSLKDGMPPATPPAFGLEGAWYSILEDGALPPLRPSGGASPTPIRENVPRQQDFPLKLWNTQERCRVKGGTGLEIKGDRQGLTLIARGFSEETGLIADLAETLAERAQFLGHARLELVVHGLELSATLLQKVATVFERYPALTLSGVKLDGSGLVQPILLHRARPLPPPLVVRQTIRSGQQVLHGGDIIIVGDVNPGATLVAGGDILVFGRLRGVAYAGQPQDPTKGVYALRFEPSQIRIGELLAIGDGRGRMPEYARVEEGTVTVSSWDDVHLPEFVLEGDSPKFSSRQATLS